MCLVFQTNGATYSLGEMLHDNIGDGGGNLTDEIYSGFIKFIHPDGYGFIECDNEDNDDGFLSNSLIQVHVLEANDEVEYSVKSSKGKTAVNRIYSVNGTSVDVAPKLDSERKRRGGQSNNASEPKELRQRIWQQATRAVHPVRSLLHLFALGGKEEVVTRATDRADSLSPYIEYVTHSLEAADYFRRKARFTWTEMPRPRTVRVSKGFASCVLIESEHLPYIHRDWPRDTHPPTGSKLISIKTGEVHQFVRSIVRNGDLYFLTSDKLIEGEQLLVPGQEAIALSWELSGQSDELGRVTMGETEFKIIEQQLGADRGQRTRLIIGGELKGDEKLEFDGQVLDWELRGWTPNGGPLWDENDIQVTDSFRLSEPFTVTSSIAPGRLRDRDGVEYAFKEDDKGRSRYLLKLQLENPVGEEEIDPMEVLFSPDRDYGELEMLNAKERGRPKMLKIRGYEHERRAIWVNDIPDSPVLRLPAYTKYLKRQKEMLENLRDYPLSHHDTLLNLTTREDQIENLSNQWPDFSINKLGDDEWMRLVGETDGTKAQRDFVNRALSTEDFCLMQGPPGSGKTTAICELIIQLAKDGKKVLLCGSTQASIDNVLNRICDEEYISPLRIGNRMNIHDENVRRWSLEDQVIRMNRKIPSSGHSESKKEIDLATDLVLQKTNLTCGTVEGILNHPLIGGAKKSGRGVEIQRPQAIWDYLIVDEASKTTFQQFIVPAAYAKRWVLVGDIRQLPPFIETSEVETNLESVIDSEGVRFSESEQRACLVLNQIMKKKGKLDINNNPYVLIEPDNVVTAIETELRARNENLKMNRRFALIHPNFSSGDSNGDLMLFHPNDFERDPNCCARLLSAEVIIIPNSFEILNKVTDYLPPWAHHRLNGINTKGYPKEFPTRHLYRLQYHGFNEGDGANEGGRKRNRIQHPLAKENLSTRWPYQISWRLNRSYELKTSNNKGRKKYEDQIGELMPMSKDISVRVNEIRSIALPSILECLQEGFTSYGGYELPYNSTLTSGFTPEAKKLRFSEIEFQHRMHGDISRFPREQFYSESSLIDADTLQIREQRSPFGYMNSRGYGSRRMWLDVYEQDINGGRNRHEVAAIRAELLAFLEWTNENPPPQRKAGEGENLWEIALLSPYQVQRVALRDMVRDLTDLQWENRFYPKKWPVSIIVSTTDRFQGQEADMVFITLRNTGRIGFLDSPNRMNVALTRAREALFVVGHWDYFAGIESGSQRMDDPMLKALALSFQDIHKKKYHQNSKQRRGSLK